MTLQMSEHIIRKLQGMAWLYLFRAEETVKSNVPHSIRYFSLDKLARYKKSEEVTVNALLFKTKSLISRTLL